MQRRNAVEQHSPVIVLVFVSLSIIAAFKPVSVRSFRYNNNYYDNTKTKFLQRRICGKEQKHDLITNQQKAQPQQQQQQQQRKPNDVPRHHLSAIAGNNVDRPTKIVSKRRRSLIFRCLSHSSASTAMLFRSPVALAAAAATNEENTTAEAADNNNNNNNTPGPIVELSSGVQYSDARIGRGPRIQKNDTVLMHLRASRDDGTVLLDTKLDGRPLLHKLGSSSSSSSSPFLPQRPRIRSGVTPGVEDAILAGGEGQGGGGTVVESMNQGEIRNAVVPAGPLAYGYSGVSRYDAKRMGLRAGVPDDGSLRYEIEILRCVDVELPPPTPVVAIPLDENGKPVIETTGKFQVCCTEDAFPCPSPMR